MSHDPEPGLAPDPAKETRPQGPGPSTRRERSERARLATAQICERCGFAMYDRHCKVLCPNCGYTRDCSDP